MKKSDFTKLIKELDNEDLCWFTDRELNEAGVMFKTTEKLLNEGVLIYEPNDNLYVGKKTYQLKY